MNDMNDAVEPIRLARSRANAAAPDEWLDTFFLSEIRGESDIRIRIRPDDLGRLRRHLQAAWRRDAEANGGKRANLGLATTGELLEELRARSEVNGTINYRTVDKWKECGKSEN